MNWWVMFLMGNLLPFITAIIVWIAWLVLSGFWYHLFWKHFSKRYCSFAHYLVIRENLFTFVLLGIFLLLMMAVIASILNFYLFIFVGIELIDLTYRLGINFYLIILLNQILAKWNNDALEKRTPGLLCTASAYDGFLFVLKSPLIAIENWDVREIRMGFYIYVFGAILLVGIHYLNWFIMIGGN